MTSYGYIPSKPTLAVDSWWKSVRADGSFGHLTVNNKVYHAKHIQLVTSSLHQIDNEHFNGEMLIVHELEGSNEHTPWSPSHSAVDTIIVSVLFKQTQTGHSPLWEAMGFPKDRSVLRRAWLENAKSQGMKGWETETLSSLIGDALKGSFYGYHGSLPVPPCWENVVYYVLENPLPVSHLQVEGLIAVLQGEDVDYNQRPAQRDIDHSARDNYQVSGSATSSCDYLEAPGRQATAACWACPAGTAKSPVNAVTSQATSPGTTPVPGYTSPNLRYHSTTAYAKRGNMALTVRPTEGHHFGFMEIGGRFYTAEMITVHAVGVHGFDGVRYDGEIHIHHYQYGDWFDRDPMDESGKQIIVAIPLEITTNPGGDFMADLQPHGPQTGSKAYLSHNDLKDVFSGDFLEYRGTPIHPPCATDAAQWLLYKTPLKVSADQLFTEYPTRSGFDTTPPLVHDSPSMSRNHVPMRSLESGRSCSAITGNPWDYVDTGCWADAYPKCGGLKQSPINIDTSKVMSKAAHLKDTFLHHAKYHPVANMRVRHNGHALETGDKQNGISHLGIGYIEIMQKFFFLRDIQIHFPSEHVTDGHQHAGEMHLVHHRQDHWGATAFENDDILVAAIMFDIGPEESPLLKQFFIPDLYSEHGVTEGWEKTMTEPLDLLRALGPVLAGDYYRYDGSFSKPPCEEIVKWFVFKTSLSISQEQWSAFKAVFKGNARPVVPLNSRDVAMNQFEAPGETYTPVEWEFFLDRKHGRNRDSPSPLVILGGVIGGVLLSILIMGATFIRQNPLALNQSAGGLAAASETVGRSRLLSNRM